MVEKLRAFIDRVLTKMRLIKYKELILYIIVGGSTTVVDWAIFTLFVLFVPPVGEGFILKISPNIISYAVAWLGAVIFAYVMSRLFVFEQTGEKIVPQFAKFFASRILTLALSIVGDMIFSNLWGTEKYQVLVAKVIISVAVVIINYITSKLIVFKKKKTEEIPTDTEDKNGER